MYMYISIGISIANSFALPGALKLKDESFA
jgi:hypothetical protein